MYKSHVYTYIEKDRFVILTDCLKSMKQLKGQPQSDKCDSSWDLFSFRFK